MSKTMSKSKKYDCRTVQNDDGWCAEIVRRATSSKVVVSKSKGGFTTEADALKWGEKELKLFISNQSERNKRDSQARKEKAR